MPLSATASDLLEQISGDAPKLGALRRIAKARGTDHDAALELWATGGTPARQLAILLLDKKRCDQDLVDTLSADLQPLPLDERTALMDWLFANQLTKTAAGKRRILTWEHSPSPLQRRTFWYQQARLRWTGQVPPPNTEALLDALEARMADEAPEVQWAMNFTAGQIGTYDEQQRARCITLGERTGLYRDEVVARNCTPSFLPQFIAIQVGKLAK